MTPRLVLGIDPGTAVTGYGVVAMDGRVTTLVECGPGKVLTGLSRRTAAGVECVGLQDSAALAAALQRDNHA